MSKLVKYDYTYEFQFPYESAVEYEHSTIYVSVSNEDIKTLCHSLWNAYKKGNTNLSPYMIDFPKFNPYRCYALKITWESTTPYEGMTFSVITANEVCQYMAIGRCVPVD